MAACWRELSALNSTELEIVAWDGKNEQVAFDRSLLEGLRYTLLAPESQECYSKIKWILDNERPDILVVPGWLCASYRRLAVQAKRSGIKVVMGMDTPWRGQWKQCLTRARYRRFLKSIDSVVVAGERTWQYAKRLGFEEMQIKRGVYGFDCHSFTPAETSSRSGFLFVGRYSPEKGLNLLVNAYKEYRTRVENPWQLNCAGMGPLSSVLQKQVGICDQGFIQPHDLPNLYRKHRAFILPSHYEPWGVVLAEAMASGLPCIATEACGAAIDLVRPYSNGIFAPTKCAKSLANAMIWFHNRSPAELDAMSAQASIAAAPFGSEHWANRWNEYLSQTIDEASDPGRNRA